MWLGGREWKVGQRPEWPLSCIPQPSPVPQKAGALLEVLPTYTWSVGSSLPPRMRPVSQQPAEGIASQGREECLLDFPLF